MNQDQLVELINQKNQGIHINLIKLVVAEVVNNGETNVRNEFCFLSDDCLDRILSSYRQLT